MSDIKLYDVFGELLYVIARADGIIQPEEVQVLDELLADHDWGTEIRWSFDFEVKEDTPVEEVYLRVISFCQAHGPDPVYAEMIKVMEEMAAAANGVEQSEENVMNGFVHELTERFKRDIERLQSR